MVIFDSLRSLTNLDKLFVNSRVQFDYFFANMVLLFCLWSMFEARSWLILFQLQISKLAYHQWISFNSDQTWMCSRLSLDGYLITNWCVRYSCTDFAHLSVHFAVQETSTQYDSGSDWPRSPDCCEADFLICCKYGCSRLVQRRQEPRRLDLWSSNCCCKTTRCLLSCKFENLYCS